MQNFKKLLSQRLLDAINIGFANPTITENDLIDMLEYPPDTTMGDIALPCFKLSRTLRRSPVQIAQIIAENLNDEAIKKAEPVNGYLNISISDSYLERVLNTDILTKGDSYGASDLGKGKTVVLDYSSPNVAKPFHIGHLGTTVIGHSLKKLHQFVGYDCVGINYLGDWGTQFGKMIVAYKKWGNRDEINAGGIDKLVELYVKFHHAAEEDPALNDEARAEFRKLELNDEENIALWKWFIEISVAEYKRHTDSLELNLIVIRERASILIKCPRRSRSFAT